MASNIKKDAEWAEAKKKCRLNEETLKMAYFTSPQNASELSEADVILKWVKTGCE